MAVMSSGYSAREIFFHGLPKSSIVKGAPSWEDAVQLAGLDWTVSLQPSYQVRNDGTLHVVPNRFLTVRDDTEFVLGSVGKQYTPFQNHEAFSFADALLGYGVEFDAAGSWDEGRQFFLTAKLPEGLLINGEEAVDLYLLFRSAHDGSCAITAQITPVRLSCTNMLSLATKEAVNRWSCRHTRTAHERVDEAARALQLVESYTVQFNAIADQLLATEMDLREFTAFVQDVVPDNRKNAEEDTLSRVQATMVETWKTSPTVDRTTRWGALQAVTETMQWMRNGRGNAESRFDSLVAGQSYQTANRATELLLRTR